MLGQQYSVREKPTILCTYINRLQGHQKTIKNKTETMLYTIRHGSNNILQYNDHVSPNILDFGYHFTYKSFDRGLIESLGPFGLSNVLLGQVKQSRAWHSGYLYHYLIIIVGQFIILFVVYFKFSF